MPCGGSSGRSRVAAEQAVARGRIAPERLRRGGHVAVAHEGGLRRQVIEQRGHRIEEQGQVVLDSRGGDAVGDVAVDALLGRIALEHLAKARAELRAARVVEREFARRQHAHFVDGVKRALRVHVEAADRLDDVVIEVEPVGQLAARGKQVDQPAAHAELARRHHLRDVVVARDRHLLAQRLDVEPLALLEEERARREIGWRAQAHERGLRGDYGEVELAALDAVERRQPLRDEVLVRREAVVGQRLPVGQQAHAQLRREPRDFLDKALRVQRTRAHGENGLGARGKLGEGERIRRAGEPGRGRPAGKRIAKHAETNYTFLNSWSFYIDLRRSGSGGG